MNYTTNRETCQAVGMNGYKMITKNVPQKVLWDMDFTCFSPVSWTD